MLLAVFILVAPPPNPTADALAQAVQMADEAKGKAVVMSRVEVTQSVLGSIGVDFSMNKPDANDPTATIYWASVTEVTPGSEAQKAGFQHGDEIILLNGQLVRGLTIQQFLAFIKRERLRGNLTWTIRRGVLGFEHPIVFNGKPGAKP